MLWLTGGVDQGVVYVYAGCLIDVALVRGPARQVIATADDAMIALLQWEDATFMFRAISAGRRRRSEVQG